jgi:hypothetical protein
MHFGVTRRKNILEMQLGLDVQFASSIGATYHCIFGLVLLITAHTAFRFDPDESEIVTEFLFSLNC